MFIAFFFIVLGLSAVLAAAGFQTVNPVNNEEVSVVNLLTAAGIADILKGFPTEWAGFSPVSYTHLYQMCQNIELLEPSVSLTYYHDLIYLSN